MFHGKFTDIVQQMIKKKLHPGDFVVDATVGNGWDTLFLAQCVGATGTVVGFDIQKTAIENTKKKLQQEELGDTVRLIHDSHSNIDQYINSPIAGAMFNLGYLPKGDANIITRPDTTIQAIDKILELLKEDGIISILCYYGHPGGNKEKQALESYLESLDVKKYIVTKIDFVNRPSNPPIIFIIERIFNI